LPSSCNDQSGKIQLLDLRDMPMPKTAAAAHMNDDLLTTLIHDQSSGTPTEIVHLPERVKRKEETEGWDGEDVD
jgi:hypothetical protein